MKKIIKEFLKKKKFVVGVPIVIKFKKIDNNFSTFKATKGTEVIKYSDVLKLIRMINNYKEVNKNGMANKKTN